MMIDKSHFSREKILETLKLFNLVERHSRDSVHTQCTKKTCRGIFSEMSAFASKE